MRSAAPAFAVQPLDPTGVVLSTSPTVATPPHIAAIAKAVEGVTPRKTPENDQLARYSGLETLTVRVDRQCASAAAIADFLAEQKEVVRVYYPGRADHPQAALAKRQMAGGGPMVAFEVKGGKEAAFGLTNALQVFKISNNLGDAKSLITHPATTTHQRLTPEVRAELGIFDTSLRLSIGLEDVDDLKADLTQAVMAAK